MNFKRFNEKFMPVIAAFSGATIGMYLSQYLGVFGLAVGFIVMCFAVDVCEGSDNNK